MGGEEPILRLVETFYRIMDELPEVETIRKMHPKDLSTSIEKLYEFLVGWSGGPPLYMDKYGHPRLRRRHMPFPIGVKERDQWMLCMRNAFDELNIPPDIRDDLDRQFFNIADFMQNVEAEEQ
jgi:hemoglobin